MALSTRSLLLLLALWGLRATTAKATTTAASADDTNAAAAAAAALGGWVVGSASFWGGSATSTAGGAGFDVSKIDSGSCGYEMIDTRLWPQFSLAGLPHDSPLVRGRPLAACGSCVEVECLHNSGCYNGSSVRVLVTDQCGGATCNDTNINLHIFSFERLAPVRAGRAAVRFRLAACEPIDPVTVYVSDFRVSGGGWLRLALKNVAGDSALVAVELAPSAANASAASPTATRLDAPDGWRRMLNTYGAVWESSRLPPLPFDLRLTNAAGRRAVIRRAVQLPGLTGDLETTCSAFADGAAADDGVTYGEGVPRPSALVAATNGLDAGGGAAQPVPARVPPLNAGATLEPAARTNTRRMLLLRQEQQEV